MGHSNTPQPRTFDPHRVLMRIRLPAELDTWLRAEAERREVSMNWLVVKALVRMQDEYEGKP